MGSGQRGWRTICSARRRFADIGHLYSRHGFGFGHNHIGSPDALVPAINHRREAGSHELQIRAARVADFDEPFSDIDPRTLVFHRDEEAGSLHHGSQIGRIHLEMRGRLLADAVECRSDRLQDLSIAVHARGWQLEAAIGADHNSIPLPHQYGATRFTCLDPTIARHNFIAPHRNGLHALSTDGNIAHHLEKLPAGLIRAGSTRMGCNAQARD